jgi:hypothetical protein
VTATPTRPRRPAGRRAPVTPRRRRPGRGDVLLAAGLLQAAVGALVAAGTRAQAGAGQPVLALARPVTAGQVITAADLRVVQVTAAGPVAVVPAGRQAQVAGQRAAATLPAGSVLAAADIGTPHVGRGQARLGVAVGPGRYPPDLSPGQRVAVLTTPAPGSSSPLPAQLAGKGVVLSVSIPAPGSPGETVVELQLPQDAVLQAAAADAAGRIILAAIPAGR